MKLGFPAHWAQQKREFLSTLGSFGQLEVPGMGLALPVHIESNREAEPGAIVPGCVRWQRCSSPDPVPGRAPVWPVEEKHIIELLRKHLQSGVSLLK